MLWTPPLHVGSFWKLQDLVPRGQRAPPVFPELLPSGFLWEGDPFLDHRYPLPNFLKWLLTVFISFSAVTFFFFPIKHKTIGIFKDWKKTLPSVLSLVNTILEDA